MVLNMKTVNGKVLCLCGRCCVGNKNQTDYNKYIPEAKAGGREVWISNKLN